MSASLAFLDGTVHVAARAHRRTNRTRSVQLDGATMTETTLVWDSEIAVGQLPVAGGDRLLTLGLDRGADLAQGEEKVGDGHAVGEAGLRLAAVNVFYRAGSARTRSERFGCEMEAGDGEQRKWARKP